jgi:hypothetical protein
MLTACSYNTGQLLVTLLTNVGIVLRFSLSKVKQSHPPSQKPYTAVTFCLEARFSPSFMHTHKAIT